jgi:hypothetical protein
MRRRICILMIGLAVGGTGCAHAIRQSRVMQAQGATGMTAAELELLVQDFTLRYGGVIEETAYRILAERPDPRVRLAVLRWRFYAVQAFQKPLFQPDPFVAVVDAWLLAEQIIQYYQEGAGRGTLGDYEAPVVETCTRLRQELGQLFTRAAGGPSSKGLDRAWAEKWVRAHPIQSHFFVRESVAPEAARTQATGGTNVGHMLVATETALLVTNTRVTLLAELIPKMVGWQIELATVEALVDPATGTMTLEHVIPVAAIRDQVQALADTQMKTAFEQVERMRVATLADVQHERQAVLDGVSAERRATFADVARERQIVLEFVAAERAQVLEGVERQIETATTRLTTERQAALAQAGRLTNDAIAAADTLTDEAIDRLFWRLLVLVGVVFVLALVYRFITGLAASGRSTPA